MSRRVVQCATSRAPTSKGSRIRKHLAVAFVAALLAACDDPAREPCVASPGIICTIAGTGLRGFNGDGLAALDTELWLPSSVRRGPDRRVYIMDFNNYRLRAIEPDGKMTTIAGNGLHGVALAGPARETPLENPIDFAFGSDGRTYLIALHDPRVFVIDRDGMLSVIAGTGAEGDSGDEGPARDATFTALMGIAVADDGRVFVSDAARGRVRQIDPGGGISGLVNGLVRPEGLAIDAAGNLYVAEVNRDRVLRIALSTGARSTVAGSGMRGFAGDGGPATSADLSAPTGIAVDSDGALYFSDNFNHRLRRVAPDGTVSTIAGVARYGFAGDGGPATKASLFGPSRLSVTDDAIYFADQLSAVIRVIYR